MDEQSQFGMTEDDLKNAKRNDFILRIKQIFSQIEPVVVKTFNTLIYYLIRLAKAFVEASVRMILGKEG